MFKKNLMKSAAIALALSLVVSAAACANTAVTGTENSAAVEEAVEAPADKNADTAEKASEDAGESSEYSEEISCTEDGAHAIEADGTEEAYENVHITKTGSSDLGDEADFYGDNAAVFATNGASLTLTDVSIETDGTHANAVFSYGEGTTVTISGSEIETSGDCSGGLMTTGGAAMNASDCNVHTTGRSSAAIRSDRGGGTVIVDGGTYTTDGMGSPAIYSTADITVSNASLTSTASQGVVVEGRNSVTLNNVVLTADNNTKNSDKSDTYQAVMIYQSMSGDAAEGLASFSMTDGTLVNKNGDIFFINNTVADITLDNVTITNEDPDGVLLRAEAAGWGNDGSNGGQVNFYLNQQTVEGDMVVDEVSALNLYLASESSFSGAINAADEGDVYVEIEDGSTWSLTGDSYISALTCSEDAIVLNGYTLYVDGTAYTEGTASEGEALVLSSGSANMGGRPEMPGNGERPEMPADGERPEMPADGEGMPQMPGGMNGMNKPEGAPDGTPPELPSGEMPPAPPQN